MHCFSRKLKHIWWVFTAAGQWMCEWIRLNDNVCVHGTSYSASGINLLLVSVFSWDLLTTWKISTHFQLFAGFPVHLLTILINQKHQKLWSAMSKCHYCCKSTIFQHRAMINCYIFKNKAFNWPFLSKSDWTPPQAPTPAKKWQWDNCPAMKNCSDVSVTQWQKSSPNHMFVCVAHCAV